MVSCGLLMKSSREETVVFLKYVGRIRVPEGVRSDDDDDDDDAEGGVVGCETAGDSESVGMVA